MFLQRRPPSYLSACELQVEKCALILWKKQYSCCHLPAAEASLLPRPRCCRGLALWKMAEARGFTQDVKWQNTGQLVTECREASFSFLLSFTDSYCEVRVGCVGEAHRCAEAVEATSNFIVFSPFLWLRRWGGAAPLWLSGVTWQQVIQPRVMNDTPGEWESRRETNRFSCNSPGARPRRPLLNFTLEWVPIGRKHPNVSWNAPVDRQVCAWFLFCHS